MTARRRSVAEVIVWPSLSWFVLLAGSLGFGLVLALSGLAQPASNLVYDSLSRAVAQAAPADIVIVAIDDASIARIGPWPWPRSTHAAAMKRLAAAGARTVLYDVLFIEPGPGDAELGAAIAVGPPTAVPVLYEIPGENGHAVSVRDPVAALASPNLVLGHATLSVDTDGIARRVKLIDRIERRTIPHVALLAAGAPPGTVPDEAMIAFAKRGTIPTIAFADVVNGSVPPEFLRGKIVLIGATASGLGDRYASAVSSDSALTPGVEMLASIVGNVRDGRLIADAGAGGAFALLAIPLVLLAFAFLRFAPHVNVAVALGLGSATLLTSGVLLAHGYWFDPAPSLIALLVLFPAWGWFRLERATKMIDRQIVMLRNDNSLFDPGTPIRPSGEDRLARQVSALETAIARSLDLRRFVQISFESLPDPAIVVRMTGEVVLANARAERLYTDYAGVPLAIDAMAVLRATLRQATDGQAGVLAMLRAKSVSPDSDHVELRTRDDRYFQLSRADFASVTGGDAFRIVRMVETTRQRRAEREREQALEFLSHDLRAPQASIIGLLDATDAAVASPLKTRLRALAVRTLAMAQAFIDIARANSAELRLLPVDLVDVVQEAIDGLWQHSREAAVRIELTLSTPAALVLADPLLLARAIGNVLTNAVSHAPRGTSVRVKIGAMHAGTAAACVRCAISDDGPGIDRAQLPRLFDRFASSGQMAGGTGLGLAMVKASVARFGGTVAVFSRLGVGTRFVLCLPLDRTVDGSDERDRFPPDAAIAGEPSPKQHRA